MLLGMRLRGLGVIRDAALELGPGLTVVTGETGAGKTMVVTALGLLLGGRADPGAVRSGSPSALIEGHVLVPVGGAVAERAREAGAELDPLEAGAQPGDGEVLIISRTIAAEGRSRAHLGGRSVPVGVLGELADHLVTVHGQSDQIRLRSPARQRAALDRFAAEELGDTLTEYRLCWQEWREVAAQIAEITERARERAQEAELLRLGVAEIERLAPQPGEDTALRAEAERLGHAEELRTAAETAHAALAGAADDLTGAADAASLAAAARRALEAARSHDPVLAGLADRVAEVGYLIADIAAECASYAASVEADPVRLAAVEERRAALAGLMRAYGADVDAVLRWQREASDRLLELDGDDDRLAGLQRRHGQLEARVAELAAEVTQARTAAAARLAAAVTEELTGLAMPDARLVVEVRPRGGGSGELGPDGADEVEMLLAPHAGAEPRPLGKGASGGELSRVMLGLEVVLGAVDPVPTFVFDEVDAGVGGRAALGIGRRLARLARTSQVLVVTHLPQVAAFADRHLTVVKSSTGEVTESGVRMLDHDERVRELARMLGGIADSGSAQAHADELLQTARAERALARG